MRQLIRSSTIAVGLLSAALTWAGPAAAGRQLLHGPRLGPGASPELQNAGATPVVQAHLTYCGGRVLSQAQIVAVLWGPPDAPPTSAQCSGNFADCLTRWYTDFVASPQFDWLDEYQTTIPADDGSAGTNQHIMHPTFYGVVQITPANTKKVVGEEEVQAELVAQIHDGNLPAPGTGDNDETIYEVHFPLGVDPSDSTEQACGAFCGYHDSWHSNILNNTGILAIIPSHMPPGYSGGRDCSECGEKSDWFANLGGTLSHESIEAITDPFVGQAGNGCSAPLGWYDQDNNQDALSYHGEIGDICEGIPAFRSQITEITLNDASGGDYTVQREWSNQFNSCLASGQDAFTITGPADPILVNVGGSSTGTVTSTLPVSGNTALPVTLVAHGTPTGVTITFDPATINAGQSSTVTVATSANAGTTGFTVGISGETGSSQAQTVLSFAAPEFASSLSGSSLALTAGGAPATLQLTTAATTGPARGFTVSAGGLAGVTVTPLSGTLGTPLTLSFSAAAGAPSGRGTLILSVVSSGIAHTTPLQTVIAGDDATLSGPTLPTTIAQGASATITITSATKSGNPQQLQLSATGLPSGITATFDPPTITSGQPSTVTLSASAVAPLLPITLTVAGKGPVATVTTTASLVIVAASGCASPGASTFALLGLVALLLRKRSRRAAA